MVTYLRVNHNVRCLKSSSCFQFGHSLKCLQLFDERNLIICASAGVVQPSSNYERVVYPEMFYAGRFFRSTGFFGRDCHLSTQYEILYFCLLICIQKCLKYREKSFSYLSLFLFVCLMPGYSLRGPRAACGPRQYFVRPSGFDGLRQIFL